MRIALSLAIAAISLTACADIQVEKPMQNTLDVYYGPGGNVQEHQEEIAELNAKGTLVRILGFVGSADTMYLGANNVCLGPKAEAGFHGASSYGLGLFPRSDGDAIMALHIPEGELRNLYWNEYKHRRGMLGKTHNAQEVHDMTGVPFCKM